MPIVIATTPRKSTVVRSWSPSMSAPPLELGDVLLVQPTRQRVEPVGRVAAVDPREQEGGHELEQSEDEGDVDVAPELVAHEVVGPVAHHDVEQVPGQERGRRRE